MSPLLERGDVKATIDAIQRNWSMAQVVDLLHGSSHVAAQDAQKVAAVALSLIGTDSCIAALAKQLQHPDRMVAQMAEHAMWSIWFRSGNCGAQKQFARGSVAFSQRRFDDALEHFDRAIESDPQFAEAYNQRAIVRYVQENFEQSLDDCRRATELMPLHFGAWAGAGHCHACLGNTCDAVRCYEVAKRINPHLECVDAIIEELKAS